MNATCRCIFDMKLSKQSFVRELTCKIICCYIHHVAALKWTDLCIEKRLCRSVHCLVCNHFILFTAYNDRRKITDRLHVLLPWKLAIEIIPILSQIFFKLPLCAWLMDYNFKLIYKFSPLLPFNHGAIFNSRTKFTRNAMTKLHLYT